MKTNYIENLFGVAVLVFLSACSASCEPTPVATEFVGLLAKGDFAAAVKHFDGTMSAAMSPEKLREAWTSLNQQAGPFQKQLDARRLAYGSLDVVIVTCQFQRAVIDVKVVLDGQRRVAGLWFLPGKAPEAASTPAYYAGRNTSRGGVRGR